MSQPHGIIGKTTDPYRPKAVPPPNVGNSGRLDSLLRGGNLYLSLQDTIALALENNLDIAIQRTVPNSPTRPCCRQKPADLRAVFPPRSLPARPAPP